MPKPTLIFTFQSPFHRGNGCYLDAAIKNIALSGFQSPFHRGNGCYAVKKRIDDIKKAFSPLFIGAMVATHDYSAHGHLRVRLSVPFSSGQWLLLNDVESGILNRDFQSPFHRGNGCYKPDEPKTCLVPRFQSPFHRGNGCY